MKLFQNSPHYSQTATTQKPSHLKGKTLEEFYFGAAYYPEYQPVDRLIKDLDLMKEANFNLIRVGESVWSTWEPESGTFNLEWMQRVLDEAHARDIKVIMGTPTYAVPPWLARYYPEIAAEIATGKRFPWGRRQEHDTSHPAFRYHAERVIRAILDRYASHPAVIGVQVDNEPGMLLVHNEGAFQRFKDYLRHQYKDVETLNKEWGLVYWSHRLSTWEDLWRPDGNIQPQYALAWRRFQADLTTEYMEWQATIAREYLREDQTVITCLAYDRVAIDDVAIGKVLDVAAGNPYYHMRDHMTLPHNDVRINDWMLKGVWNIYFAADRMYSSRGDNFYVTETNAMATGEPWRNTPAYEGQWRQAAWALVARGANMIEYWHWHSIHFGAETYCMGILPHSGEPGRMYEEIAQLGKELASVGELLVDMKPDADVAFLYSHDNLWMLQEDPQLPVPGEFRGDGSSYHGYLQPFYKGAFTAGLQSRIIHPSALPDVAAAVQQYPIVVAAGLLVSDDATRQWLLDYAHAGGHLIMGPRTAYCDEEARPSTERQPTGFAEAAGVWYEEVATLEEPINLVAADRDGSAKALIGAGSANLWVDGLKTTGAEILWEYDHPHFGRFPAATTNAVGPKKGRITYVGTLPDLEAATALFTWASEDNPWKAGDTITTTSGTTDQGTLRFIHNWSWTPNEFTLPGKVLDVLSSDMFSAGESLQLGPWDVRVVLEQ